MASPIVGRPASLRTRRERSRPAPFAACYKQTTNETLWFPRAIRIKVRPTPRFRANVDRRTVCMSKSDLWGLRSFTGGDERRHRTGRSRLWARPPNRSAEPLAPSAAQSDSLFFVSFDLKTTHVANDAGGRVSAHPSTDGLSPALLHNERILRILYRSAGSERQAGGRRRDGVRNPRSRRGPGRCGERHGCRREPERGPDGGRKRARKRLRRSLHGRVRGPAWRPCPRCAVRRGHIEPAVVPGR